MTFGADINNELTCKKHDISLSGSCSFCAPEF